MTGEGGHGTTPRLPLVTDDGNGRLLLAVGLAAGPLVALGLARFAYALLLPAMSEDLGWSYSAAGALNTANAAGYLIGAVIATTLARTWGTRRAFVAGTAVTTVALALTAVTSTYAVLLTIRFVAGLSGALAFVLGAALVAEASHRGTPGRAAVLLGVYFGGAGAGIVAAGLLVPWVLDVTDGAGWRQGWLTLAAVGVVATVAAVLAARRVSDPAPPGDHASRWDRRRIGWAVAAYTCFGLGYIAYLTFISQYLTEQGMSGPLIAGFWAVVGLAAAVSGLAWGPLLGRLGGARGMAVVMTALAVGTILPVVLDGAVAAYLSGAVVGGSFLAVVTAVSIAVRESLPQPWWTAGIAFATVAFGLGQTVGPTLTGWVSDVTADLGTGLLLSGAILVVGAGTALLQRRPA
ncbi:YbfB/YjiJ family MFS transporter [Ornithinimicrobium sp. F0845]|uniref:YbfB/YjiJ family MFS transporter n=1 Tax=Ornithinimicrobium sp. F0845 TaxID=2926412 RepID=UPI001FF3C3BD|nr:YbfB/YjiJ family MFS transporter [Ornithinimicrobium sp. F0845]MCK0110628.1 YbfB/YjiJ family MFS transporter [Ornithinimicrobium sp. F0845]